MLGGDIKVNSEIGSGSTFILTIPYAIPGQHNFKDQPTEPLPETEFDTLASIPALANQTDIIDDRLVLNEYDQKVLVELINKHFPDWRRVLNECQRYSANGKIDSAILASFSDVKTESLIKNLKEKNFTEVRKWCINNLDNDPSLLFRRIYDALLLSLDPPSIPAAVLVIAKYQYQVAFVADQEINLLAGLTEIMVECKFK